MTERLLIPLRLIARMNFSLTNYSCELFNLNGTVGKVELLSTFTTAVCESWNVSDKYTWDNAGELRLRLHGTIYRPDSFVLMLRYCANLKVIRYESTSLKGIVADKSHRVIVALSNYPWTRLSVRIIGAIKRQFFSHGNVCFDNSKLSQESFAIDIRRAVICSLGHGRKTDACDPSDYMETMLYRPAD